jgi:hypothetical protein
MQNDTIPKEFLELAATGIRAAPSRSRVSVRQALGMSQDISMYRSFSTNIPSVF